MKKFIRSAWVVFCVILIICFIISCFSVFIPPLSFSYITLFALAFPYLLVLIIISIIVNIFKNRKFAAVMLLCLPPAYINISHTFAFNAFSKFNNEKDSASLRVMTWNVQDFVDLSFKSDVRSQMLNVITEKNPDILCLQELTNVDGGKWRVSVIKELDSIGYKFNFLSRDEVTTNKMDAVVTRGVAIFSKLPLIGSSRVLIKNEGLKENLIYTNIKFKNRLLRIYTAHLASFQLYTDTDRVNKDVYHITYDRKRVIQYKLREVERLHQQEAQIIHNQVSNAGFPAIYCGDMNAVPCSYNYRLIRNNFQDAFLKKGFGVGATFYKILPTLRIDYCFADKRLRVENCTVITKKLSDHYPVVTDFQWK